jgi:hypothetical protein
MKTKINAAWIARVVKGTAHFGEMPAAGNGCRSEFGMWLMRIAAVWMKVVERFRKR